ncbi:MFS transporter [Maritimibacter dapengensis]|uniref:MFS transporter n=1 Tax=Maritimibacter dapengensis TaxID=2836868 RepID=A0ABS6T110_9RHOB|nr:MFS transporter [Maritimibacter dapengensis]MBV7378251.1 MFS transporter [Maritimibacter dapengensis]
MDRTTRLALNLLSLTMFSVGACMFVAIGTLPDIAPSLGVTRAEAGMVIATYAFGSAIGAPLLQILVGHLPRKRLVVVGLAVLGAGMVMSALAPSYELVLAGRIVSALGGSVASPVASALGASLVANARQGQALAIVFGGMTIASAVVAPVATWMGAHLGWRPTFAVFGLTVIGFAVLTQLRVPETGPGERLNGRVLIETILRPVNLTGILVPVVTLAGLFATFTMITLYYFEHIGATAEETSVAMLLYGAAGVAGNYIARYVTRIWPAERTMTTAILVIATALVALYLMPPLLVPATIAVIVWSSMLALFFPAQQQRMIAQEPHRAGLILALNTSSLYVGMSAGSFVAGRVDAALGLAPLPLVSALILAGALAMLALSARIARRQATLAPAQ